MMIEIEYWPYEKCYIFTKGSFHMYIEDEKSVRIRFLNKNMDVAIPFSPYSITIKQWTAFIL